MANPLPDEDKIYETIKRNKIRVHKSIWKLLSHHLGNDIFVIMVIVGDYMDQKEPIPLEQAREILERCKSIKNFLDKLRKSTFKE